MLAARAVLRGPVLRAPLAYTPSVYTTQRWRTAQAQPHTPEAPTQRRQRKIDAPPTVAPPAKAPAPKAAPAPVPAAKPAVGTAPAPTATATATAEAEQMRMAERMLDMALLQTDVDVYNQPIALLDVRIPHADTKWYSRADWPRTKENLVDWAKTAYTMHHMATHDALPGAGDVGRAWSLNVLRARSTDPKAWVAGLRAQLLESYIKLNEAITTGNLAGIRRYSSGAYAERSRRLARQLTANSDRLYTWELLSERTPLQLASLRMAEVNYQAGLPARVSRNVVHALARVDTRQRLRARKRRGGAHVLEEERDVVEHLVFERRLWQDAAVWTVRDQVWEGEAAEFVNFDVKSEDAEKKAGGKK